MARKIGFQIKEAAASLAASELAVGQDNEPRYDINKLELNCLQLFGVSTSTYAGATYKMTGKYTVKEMIAHIEAWKKKGVK